MDLFSLMGNAEMATNIWMAIAMIFGLLVCFAYISLGPMLFVFIIAKLQGRDIVIRHIGNGRVILACQKKGKNDFTFKDKDEGSYDWTLTPKTFCIFPNNVRFTHVFPGKNTSMSIETLLEDKPVNTAMDAKMTSTKINLKAAALKEKTEDQEKRMTMLAFAAAVILAVGIAGVLLFDHMGKQNVICQFGETALNVTTTTLSGVKII